MPIVPALPPQTLASKGGFDYVTVDAARRRVYAAHGGAKALLVADADTGKVLGEVPVGPMAGVAVDPQTGHVYTGDGDDKAVSEVDPVSLKEVHRVAVDGPVDAIQYDPATHRIFADEDDGTRIFVVDATSFKLLKTIVVPGHKPEYLQIDPTSHNVYQNIASDNEIAVIDGQKLDVANTFKTPELNNNHPLQLDAAHGTLFTAGENGVMSVYTTAGKKVASGAYPGRVDQCDLDASHGMMACFGGGFTLFAYDGTSLPKQLATLAIARSSHTGAIDPKTKNIWTVWTDEKGAHLGAFKYNP